MLVNSCQIFLPEGSEPEAVLHFDSVSLSLFCSFSFTLLKEKKKGGIRKCSRDVKDLLTAM